MKSKYKNRSRVTLSRALETCLTWAGQELVQLAVGCQAPKEQGLRGGKGGGRVPSEKPSRHQ